MRFTPGRQSRVAAIMPLILAAVASSANAQDADENKEEAEEIEEVVVTGFRQSLRTAQAQKENAATFLDAISAEDIGALADRSVAEALQRVPGITIGRFQQADDPDRFSVEGTGIVIRGLPFVRSELNGRDIFSANGGRVLSFNDVSPELLGGIQVFKNLTADMIEGGIAGTVNLITRKPLDREGFRIAGTAELNYGDLAEEVSPAFSVLASNTWDTSAGRFGLQLGYAQSELITRTDASQVTDPCYRDPALDGPCIRFAPVSSAGIGDPNFAPEDFPPADAVIVPKGAGVRTTEFDRDRRSYSAVAQYETPDGSFTITAEYLRAEAELFLNEFSILALVNDDLLFPVPGSELTFDGNVFQSGLLTQFAGRGRDDCLPGSFNAPDGLTRPCNVTRGIATESLRFQERNDNRTEDFSVTVNGQLTDRLTVNFEAQQIDARRDADGFIAAAATYADIFLDISSQTPDVEFRAPAVADGSTVPDYFNEQSRSYPWFLIDNRVRNNGELTSLRGDFEYDFEDDLGFIKAVRFGARWADRNRQTSDDQFANWGNLSAPWLGSAIYGSNPAASGTLNTFNPFADFQRGNAGTPLPEGSSLFFGGTDLLGDYLNGTITDQANAIQDAWNVTIAEQIGVNLGRLGTEWSPLGDVPISDVGEETIAGYIRVDYGAEDFIADGWLLEGNIGVRYVDTTVIADGVITFPTNIPDTQGALDQACDPATLPPGGTAPGFCFLSPERQAEFLAAAGQGNIDDSADISFDHWLPSFNAKLEIAEGVLFRAAISRAITRPDLAAFETRGTLQNNTNDLRDGGALDTGPLFFVGTGNRLLRPIESWNFDLSFEWYFAALGQLSVSTFYKDLDNLIAGGASTRTFTSSDGVDAFTEVRGPVNDGSGTIQGVELAFQTQFESLPEPFNALGVSGTYTYVDADIGNPSEENVGPTRSAFAEGLPLQGLSEHTINATVFFENDVLSARLAYNWRDDFLATPRDVIFPFSPIIGEATGQLDGSIFYTVMDGLKVGVQAVNILDEVTRTSQVIDFDGTTLPRSAFRNDRRFTFLVRFDF